MKTKIKQCPAHKNLSDDSQDSNFRRRRCGSVLVLVAVTIIILAVLGLAMLSIASGVRHRASILKNEAAAMLAAEAGYERAILWMSQQMDMLSALQQNVAGTSGAMSLPGGSFDYQIGLYAFVRSRPIYRVVSNGHSGIFSRTVDAYVVQAISGWDMGQCRIPTGGTSFTPVNFASGEIIDVPMHINKLNDYPDYRDIYISGSPRFLREVAMGESKGSKYPSYIMALFEGGICFNQPDSRITDEAAVQMKVNRFRASTDDDYNFSDDTAKKPVATASAYVPNPHASAQIEFFVEGGVGKVMITNNCTVRGYQRSSNNTTLDFEIKPKDQWADPSTPESQRYDIYAYHYKSNTELSKKVDVTDTYVTQSFGGVESEPAGQIFIDGDVVIGSGSIPYPNMAIQGKVTVVATGNIWIADSVQVSNYDDDGNYYPRQSDGMPGEDNPNILGLIAQGVIKIVDPGISGYPAGGSSSYPGPPKLDPNLIGGFVYMPVGNRDTGSGKNDYDRHLLDPMVVEAAMVIGSGGWGAENVETYYWGTTYGGRKEWPGSAEDPEQDFLIVRGTIVECCRGVVGRVDTEGYVKRYYFDERVLTGILPGDIWLQGKYVSAPAGWHDYRQ